MPADGRYALIVAAGTFHDPKLRKLRAPAFDAEQLATVLGDPDIGDFDVQLGRDEDESHVRRRIARFFTDRRPDDLLLMHFSGHGIKDENGELYLAAKDTEVGDMLSATGISAAWLNDQIGRCRSKRVVVLLDCCFSGSFPFGMRARATDSVNVRDHLDGRGRAIITASSATEFAWEGDKLSGRGEPSIFTQAVVEGLRTGTADCDRDEAISVDDLYQYVYDRVKSHTPSQSPNKMSTLEGRVVLARSVYREPVVPAKLNDELLALARNPLPPARVTAVQELGRLLNDPEERVAVAARQVLDTMVDDDSRQVREAVAAVISPDPETDSHSARRTRREPSDKSSARQRKPSTAPRSRQSRRLSNRWVLVAGLVSWVLFAVGWLLVSVGSSYSNYYGEDGATERIVGLVMAAAGGVGLLLPLLALDERPSKQRLLVVGRISWVALALGLLLVKLGNSGYSEGVTERTVGLVMAAAGGIGLLIPLGAMVGVWRRSR